MSDEELSGYPTSFEEVGEWGRGRSIPASEARRRFAQYAVLRGVASSRLLGRLLVFKGGNALDFVWSPNRSTLDLDFSVDMSQRESRKLTEERVAELLSGGLAVSERDLGVRFGIHSVRRQPPGEGKTFVTYTARIGYALPDDRNNRTRLEAGRPSTLVIPVEISVNEPIGADESLSLSGGGRPLRVSTLEDIVAEKLRAYLQQKGDLRNRHRGQDLLDIAFVLRRHDLDRALVSRFLLDKARARNVPVSKAAFHAPELADRARQDYEGLRDTVREDFIPFEEALEAVLGFVKALAIPSE